MRPSKLQSRIGKPSPSMLVAVAALIVALGGTSYAATRLSKNSVGPRQIKKNAVTKKKIRKNSVTARKISKNAVTTSKIRARAVSRPKLRSGAVTSSKVKNHSLHAWDFQRNSLPSGPRGATGPAGPIEGPAGGDLTGTYPNPELDAPAARAKSTGEAQVVPTSGGGAGNNPVPIGLDTEVFDTGDIYLAPDDQITVKKRGTYAISAQLGWTGASTTGTRQLRIIAGGRLTALDDASASGGTIRQTATGLARLGVGESVSLVAYQNSGTPLGTNVNAGLGGAWLAVNWVGP